MWLVLASGNGALGITGAARILADGGMALDAVEIATRLVESGDQDESVGVGGLPNVLGQLEQDASIMDGRTLAAGTVGALQGYEHPISVARRVMEMTPHVMLVGEGARRFAAELGLPRRKLPLPAAKEKWRQRLRESLSEAEVDALGKRAELLPVVREMTRPSRNHDTVNLIARDTHGDLACAVSTSGWAWKYPGRLGDSPIIGAGNYADNRYGAAACTGSGELAIRCGTARSVVLYMKMGLSVEEACREAMRDLEPLLAAHEGMMCILAMDRDGHPFSITNTEWGAHYLAMTPDSSAPEQRDAAWVAQPS